MLTLDETDLRRVESVEAILVSMSRQIGSRCRYVLENETNRFFSNFIYLINNNNNYGNER